MKNFYINPDDAKQLNTLAREQLKHKLLADINIDLMICKIEWWNYKEYLLDIKSLIDNIIKDNSI